MKPYTSVDIPFLYGEAYRYHIVPFERIEQIPTGLAGLYSWHIRIKPGPEEQQNKIAKLADKLFMQSTLDATVQGKIRLTYEGTLNKKSPEIENAGISFFRHVLFAVGYPLYIGVSVNLKSRLMTHKKQLEQHVLPGATSVHSEQQDADTDEESKYFGARLGELFSEASSTRIDCLYVRFVVHPDCIGDNDSALTFDRKAVRRDLIAAESHANSLFNPVFGRR